MGNSLGGKKTTKVMKISGETFKLKAPVRAEEVLRDYPRHALLESESVKHYGIRAKPLQPHQNLGPKRLYFLVETRNLPKERAPRRVRSGTHVSAMERLESLKLSRRSVSDLSIMKHLGASNEAENGKVRIKLKLPRAQVEKLVRESGSEGEAARRIVDLCVQVNRERGAACAGETSILLQKKVHWDGSVVEGIKAGQKGLGFVASNGGGTEITVAS